MPATAATVRPKKPIFVHLGNVGEIRGLKIKPNKTRAFAKRFKGVKFVGIDAARAKIEAGRKNIVQIQAGFRAGLRKLADSSVSVISSEMALGYYGMFKLMPGKHAYEEPPGGIEDYTRDSLAVAHQKLKPGGKMLIVAGGKETQRIQEALIGTGFMAKDAKTRPLRENEYNMTYWTTLFKQREQELFHTTLVKQK